MARPDGPRGVDDRGGYLARPLHLRDDHVGDLAHAARRWMAAIHGIIGDAVRAHVRDMDAGRARGIRDRAVIGVELDAPGLIFVASPRRIGGRRRAQCEAPDSFRSLLATHRISHRLPVDPCRLWPASFMTRIVYDPRRDSHEKSS